MKCPHCLVEIHAGFRGERLSLAGIAGGGMHHNAIGGRRWSVSYMSCPACDEPIIYLTGDSAPKSTVGNFMAYPSTTGRAPAPTEVPKHMAEDYHEACAVLKPSPKASAALSRRCLQAILRENGFAQKDLAPAIQAALDSKQLPGAIADNLDAIRNIGNFAAHPMKDTSTGQILPVAPHEADWNLDVIEELFDFYYVQPEKARQRRAALDAKLAAAGKPPMK
ncbi:hypothetical protein P3T16_004696 [Paraburkholderia sp. GAS42]|jgi:hypothetical protein